jgi:hypothetical protein
VDDFARAKEVLLYHVNPHDDTDSPRGFLGSLRSYRGLQERNLHEVIAAVAALAPHFQEAALDREIVTALWQVCFFARYWGLRPDSMLQRNHLISEEDTRRLAEWVDAIEEAVVSLLSGFELHSSLDRYRQVTGRETLPSL